MLQKSVLRTNSLSQHYLPRNMTRKKKKTLSAFMWSFKDFSLRRLKLRCIATVIQTDIKIFVNNL
jgi:hypothetical protein